MRTRPCRLSAGLLLVWVAMAPVARAEVPLPAALTYGDTSLVLNGAGVRTKFFMDMYTAGLYLGERSKLPQEILDRNAPMAIKLRIVSSLITAEKMQRATHEGFRKSTRGEVARLQAEIDQFINVFSEGIAKGDEYDFVYQPDRGVQVYKNTGFRIAIPGLGFKSALFGIWLSDDPVQNDLKNSLLGK